MSPAAPLNPHLAALRQRSGEWRPVYDDFVEGLRRIGAGATSPVEGEEFPPFSLPDAGGRYRSLDALLAAGPLVLSFNRGGWCRYCASELRAWGERLGDLADVGGHFVAITPEVGGRAAALGRLLHGDAEILCDVDHGVALATGLAFFVGQPLLRRYAQSGLDLEDLYGSSSGFLPIPATYLIDPSGTVRFAFVDPDFRIRAEPDDVIAVVRELTR